MAVKRKEAARSDDAPAAPKKAAAKKVAPKKKAAPALPADAEKGAAKPAAAKKAAPKKKAAAVKLTDNQKELLKRVQGAGAAGLPADSKAVERSLEALKDKKLIKKGKKDKASGHVHYHLSKAGEKHLSAATNPTS